MAGFKKFLLRGNVVDLAVAVVIGVAFGALVQSLVNGLINPLIAAVFGKPDLSDVGTFTVNDADFSVGLVLTALVNFLAIAAAVYFLVVLPVNKLMERFKTEPEVSAPTRECPHCLSSIPEAASRCAFCTADLGRELSPGDAAASPPAAGAPRRRRSPADPPTPRRSRRTNGP